LRDPTGKWRASGISQQSILHQGYLPQFDQYKVGKGLQILEGWLLGKAAQIPKNAGEVIMINRKNHGKKRLSNRADTWTWSKTQPTLWSCSPWAPLGSSQKDARAPGQAAIPSAGGAASILQAMSTRAWNPSGCFNRIQIFKVAVCPCHFFGWNPKCSLWLRRLRDPSNASLRHKQKMVGSRKIGDPKTM